MKRLLLLLLVLASCSGVPAVEQSSALPGLGPGPTPGGSSGPTDPSGATTSATTGAILISNGSAWQPENVSGQMTVTATGAMYASAQTGTGNTMVMSVSPVLTTPNIGTPSVGTLTNCTGLPVNSLVTGATTAATTPATSTQLGYKVIGTDVTSATSFATTNVTQNMESITLPAGDWQVFAHFTLTTTTAATSSLVIGVSSTSASLAGSAPLNQFGLSADTLYAGVNFNSADSFAFTYANTTTTTIYFVGTVSFASGAPKYQCSLYAVARR